MDVTPQIRDALQGHDEAWLAVSVSALEGRRFPYRATTAREWIESPERQEPSRIFAIEVALGLPPASLSRRLGYLPADLAAAAGIEVAVAADPAMSEVAGQVLIDAFLVSRPGRYAMLRARHRWGAFREALTDALQDTDPVEVGSRLGGVPRTVLGDWMAGKAEPPHYVVFQLEEILELAPGALARHLGYVPVSVEAAHDVEDAISRDVLLEPTDRDALVTLYRDLSGTRHN